MTISAITITIVRQYRQALVFFFFQGPNCIPDFLTHEKCRRIRYNNSKSKVDIFFTVRVANLAFYDRVGKKQPCGMLLFLWNVLVVAMGHSSVVHNSQV